MPGLDDIMDVSEAAATAGVTPARLRQLIDGGQLRAKKIGNSWAILATDLDAFLGRDRPAGRPDERRSLESRLRVELRPMSPIQISLFPYASEIRLWFRIDNRSPYAVELDRMVIEVWYPQPVAEGAILDRYPIPPNDLIDTPQFHAWLPSDKADLMRRVASDDAQHAELQVYFRAYFATELGMVPVQGRLVRQKGEFPVQMPPVVPSS